MQRPPWFPQNGSENGFTFALLNQRLVRRALPPQLLAAGDAAAVRAIPFCLAVAGAAVLPRTLAGDGLLLLYCPRTDLRVILEALVRSGRGGGGGGGGRRRRGGGGRPRRRN